MSIDPLDPDQHPDDGLINMVTGNVVSDPKVNVDKAITIATSEMNNYEGGWPASFYRPIGKKVQTMAKAERYHKPEQLVPDRETRTQCQSYDITWQIK